MLGISRLWTETYIMSDKIRANFRPPLSKWQGFKAYLSLVLRGKW